MTVRYLLGLWALVLLPLLTPRVEAQSTQLEATFTVTDPSPGGTLNVFVRAKTADLAPNNTFGSATVDLSYDPTHLTPAGVTNGVLVGDDGYAISVNDLDDAEGNYIRLTVTSTGVGTGFGARPGHDLGTDYELLQQYSFTITEEGAANGTTDLTFRRGSLSIGYYDSPSNDDGSGVIVDNTSGEVPITEIHDAAAMPLPVELAGEVKALQEDRNLVMTWETTSETFNAGYRIELKGEEGGFRQIGTLDGNSGGNTYRFATESLDYGTYTLRLKQFDFDGTVNELAEIEATVGLAEAFELQGVYPNPFQSRAQVAFAVREMQKVQVDLYDMLGRKVKRLYDEVAEGNTTLRVAIEGSALASGTYIIRFAGEEFQATQKITLVK